MKRGGHLVHAVVLQDLESGWEAIPIRRDAGDLLHLLPLVDLHSFVAVVPRRDVLHPGQVGRNRAGSGAK